MNSMDLHEKVFAASQHLHEQNNVLEAAYLQFLSLYTGRSLQSHDSFIDTVPLGGQRIRLNALKAATDTATAMMGANRPRPQVLSIKGDRELRKRAERMTRYINGQFHFQRQWDIGLTVFPSAVITGHGFQQVGIRNERLYHEFVPSNEVMFDKPALQLPHPRWYIRKKNVPKDVLFDEYASNFYAKKEGAEITDAEAAIDNASLLDESATAFLSESVEEYITCYEAVYLPWSRKGRRCVFTSEGLLSDEKIDFWPMPLFKWNGIPGHFLGQGAIEEAQSIQNEIDEISQKIQELMTIATSIVLKRRGTNMRRVTNENWGGYEWSGSKPEFLNITSVSAEYFAHLDRLYSRLFEILGVSQMSATGQKPVGLEAAEALRTLNDVGSKRFKHTANRWEEFHMEVAKLDIETARYMSEKGMDTSLLVGDDEEVEMLDFEECSIEKNMYRLRIRPTSILPDEPSGKIEMLKAFAEMVKGADPSAGIHVLSLMANVPDLEGAIKEFNAPRILAETLVDNILDHGEYTAPYPEMDLLQARLIATQAISNALVEKVDGSRVTMLRNYIQQIDDFLEKAQPAVSPVGGPTEQPAEPPVLPAPQPGVTPNV